MERYDLTQEKKKKGEGMSLGVQSIHAFSVTTYAVRGCGGPEPVLEGTGRRVGVQSLFNVTFIISFTFVQFMHCVNMHEKAECNKTGCPNIQE